jgi:DNA replication protein DnaC
MNHVQLTRSLKALKLSGLLGTLEVRAHEAMGAGLSHLEFLELLINDELAVRGDRAIARRVKAAGLRDTRSLEEFGFNPKIQRRQIMELATSKSQSAQKPADEEDANP